MSYSTTWQYSNDPAFQGLCRAGLWDVANQVVNGAAGFPAVGQEHADPQVDVSYARKVLKDETRITGRVLAMQVLRNATIAADPSLAADADIQYAINAERWAELREIN